MNGLVVLSVLVSFAMICACQKQDSAAEAQLAQRKAELDVREKALDEKEKALAGKEKMIARFRAIPSDLQARKPAVDPEQAKAEREQRIQQLPPELQALIRDRSSLDPLHGKTHSNARPGCRTTASSRRGTQEEDERNDISKRGR
jgi:hypothetical protein